MLISMRKARFKITFSLERSLTNFGESQFFTLTYTLGVVEKMDMFCKPCGSPEKKIREKSNE